MIKVLLRTYWWVAPAIIVVGGASLLAAMWATSFSEESRALQVGVLIFYSLTILIYSMFRMRTQLELGLSPTHIIPIVVAGVSLGAGVSGITALVSPEDTKLLRLNVTGVNEGAISSPVLAMTVALLASSTLFSILDQTGRPMKPASRTKTPANVHNFLLLLSLAAIATSLFNSAELAERGTAEGDGLTSLLYWSMPIAAATGIINGHWMSKWRFATTVVLVAYLVGSANRSPLLVVAIALAVKLVSAGRKRVLAAVLGVAPFVAMFFSAISVWRGYQIIGQPISFYDAFIIALADPLRTFTSSGFDTLFGLQFSQLLSAQGVRAEWWTPLMAVGNFVPRQLWPDKPLIFGTQITTEFIGTSSGGIFLSGLGYLTLLTGSTIAAIGIFGLIVVTFRHAVTLAAGDMVLVVLLATGLLRFTMAGDPFDLYLLLQSVLIYGAARLLPRIFDLRKETTNWLDSSTPMNALPGPLRASRSKPPMNRGY